MGAALVVESRPYEALGYLRKALESSPDWLDCLQDVAQLCEDLEEWDDALDAYRRVLALDPERVQESCAIAEILRRSERYEEAIESYRATLAIDAGFVFALSGMGDALRMLERNNEALEWFEKALERKPTHVFALRGQAAALNALGRHEEASTYWKRSLDIEPDTEVAINGLKNSLIELEQTTRGPIVDHTAPIPSRNSIPDGDARQTFDEGRSLLNQGRYLDAIHKFRVTTELEVDWDEPWYLIGVAWEEDLQFQKPLARIMTVWPVIQKTFPRVIGKRSACEKTMIFVQPLRRMTMRFHFKPTIAMRLRDVPRHCVCWDDLRMRSFGSIESY